MGGPDHNMDLMLDAVNALTTDPDVNMAMMAKAVRQIEPVEKYKKRGKVDKQPINFYLAVKFPKVNKLYNDNLSN